MKIKARAIALTAALVVVPSLCFSFGAAGEASSPYLVLPMGVRGEGMGEAYTAIADNVEAMYYNPAGLTQLNSADLLLGHDESFAGIRYENVALAVPAEQLGVNIWGTVGISYTLVDIENTPRTIANADGSYDQAYANLGYYYTAGDSDVAVSYAWQATKLYSVGATIKFINEKVDTFSGWGAAADFGLFANASSLVPGLQAGMSLQNVGTSPDESPLPMNLRLGIADKLAHPFTDPDEDDDTLTTDFDFILPIVPVDGVPGANLGTEYLRWFGHTYTNARIGYRIPDDLGALAGLSVGCGIGTQTGGNDFSLDYSFEPEGVLGMSNRVAIDAQFGVKMRVIKPRSKGPLVVPTGLTAKAMDKGATLAWDPSPVRVDGYNVYMSYNPIGGRWYRVKSHDYNSTVVNKLFNGYTVYFAVTSIRRRADGFWEESPRSEAVAVRPTAPGAASNYVAPVPASNVKAVQRAKSSSTMAPPPLP